MSRRFQGCVKSITIVSILRKVQECLKVVSNECQASFKRVSWKFQGHFMDNFKGVSKVLRGVLRKFYGT